MFEKAIPIHVQDYNQCFTQFTSVDVDRYMDEVIGFRHCFEFEKITCTHPVDSKIIQNFFAVDQKEHLLHMREGKVIT